MTNRFPLIANSTSSQIQELASGDFLDLSQSGIANSGNITVSGVISASGNVYGSNIVGTYLYGCGGNLTGVATSGNAIINGSSNVSIANSNGPISMYEAGTRVGYISNNGIALGSCAGQYVQGVCAIAIGHLAGSSSQGNNAIAIGLIAGGGTQGNNAIAIGVSAGSRSQGGGAIAIGQYAGCRNQANNTIILNATQNSVCGIPGQPCRFYVAPIRNDVSNTANVLYYNTSTNEITFAPSTGGGSNVAEATFDIRVSSFTARAGNRYGVDTSSGVVVATLPTTTNLGQAVFFADAGGAFATNNLIIDPVTNSIMGGTAGVAMAVSTNNVSVGLFYNGTTWRIYNAG